MCLKIGPICRLLHGQPREPLPWNYFPLLTGRIVLANKKRNLRKYSIVLFKAFPKKGYLAEPVEGKKFKHKNVHVQSVAFLFSSFFFFFVFYYFSFPLRMDV